MKDLDALGALILGLIVFAILASAPHGQSATRYEEATPAEATCVNYIALAVVYRVAEPGSNSEQVAEQGILALGLQELTNDGYIAIQKGAAPSDVLPALYKACLSANRDIIASVSQGGPNV